MLHKVASVLVVSLVPGCARPQATTIPDTPAGHTLQAWLDAIQ